MLKISNLNANVENKSILKGFSLNINPDLYLMKNPLISICFQHSHLNY